MFDVESTFAPSLQYNTNAKLSAGKWICCKDGGWSGSKYKASQGNGITLEIDDALLLERAKTYIEFISATLSRGWSS